MAQKKSKIATVGEEKSENSYIDSGATNHFFHRRSAFETNESMQPELVSTAEGNSYLVGKGTVYFSIGGGITVTADHASQFTSHILANYLLSD